MAKHNKSTHFTPKQQKLKEAIVSLPKPERNFIILYYFEELTIREIAATLFLSMRKVRKLRHSALLRLRIAVNGVEI